MTSFLRLRSIRRRKDRDLSRPEFPADETLVKRQIAQAEKLGPNSIKRIFPEKRPDYGDLELQKPIG